MTRAAIYLRISRDPRADGLAVDRQRSDCRRIADERGWEVVAEYEDSLSASRRDVARPNYERMRRDFEAGRFDALIVWDLDRLTRQPRQLEDWIDAAEDTGLRLVTANGEADLATDNGRLFARVKASVARSEVERKSARQRRANEQRAEQGKPHATHRVFGWEPDGITLRESEVAILREMHERILAGGSIRSIVRWLQSDQVPTPRGGGWGPAKVRKALLRERNAGILIRHGVEQPTSQIEPAVTREVWEAVRAILTDAGRNTTPGRQSDRWWLAGVLECSCGSLMGSKHVRGRGGVVPSYICRVALERPQPGHQSITASVAEPAVAGAILEALVERGDVETPEDAEVIRLTRSIGEAEQERVAAQELFMLPGADKTHASLLIAEAGAKIDALAAQRNAALAGRAGASIIDQVRDLIAAEVRFAKASHPANAASVPWAEVQRELDAIYADRARWIEAFNALPVEIRRNLGQATVRAVVRPAKEAGYGSKRLVITPR